MIYRAFFLLAMLSHAAWTQDRGGPPLPAGTYRLAVTLYEVPAFAAAKLLASDTGNHRALLDQINRLVEDDSATMTKAFSTTGAIGKESRFTHGQPIFFHNGFVPVEHGEERDVMTGLKPVMEESEVAGTQATIHTEHTEAADRLKLKLTLLHDGEEPKWKVMKHGHYPNGDAWEIKFPEFNRIEVKASYRLRRREISLAAVIPKRDASSSRTYFIFVEVDWK